MLDGMELFCEQMRPESEWACPTREMIDSAAPPSLQIQQAECWLMQPGKRNVRDINSQLSG
jgi:hypothetical protein